MALRVALVLACAVASTAEAAAQEISEQRVRAAVEDAARGLGQTVAGGSPMTAPAAPRARHPIGSTPTSPATTSSEPCSGAPFPPYRR